MEDVNNGPQGPQLYVLSERGYGELKDAQDILRMMAQLAYGDDDSKHGVAMLRIPRVTLHLFFDQMSALIGDALAGIGKENEMGKGGWRLQ